MAFLPRIVLIMLYFSVIVPVYNRPNEIEELLSTLIHQTYKHFELIIVEDGSTIPSEHVVHRFQDQLTIRYFNKNKEGPSAARNFGMKQATGDYLVLFDSDLLVPPQYFEETVKGLEKEHWDCYGGPDRAHESFTDLQKAINYSMTSFLTTGGIRGNKKHVGQFNPRSFNMGFSRQVFEKVGGFIDMHPGEDIDFSLRILKEGFKVGLIPDAFVYHKRRSTFKKFYTQVYRFGLKRIELYKLHPHTLKATHWFPTLFSAYFLSAVALALLFPPYGYWYALPLALYLIAIIIHATMDNGSLTVGFTALATTLIQMFGYGKGFWENYWKLVILNKDKGKDFRK